MSAESAGSELVPGATDLAELRVLVVDDEADIRLGLRKLLGKLGIAAREAPSGDAGLVMLGEGEADLILTDLNMPGISGSEFLARVKQSRPETAVIVLTGYGTVATAVSCLKAGAAHFLTKPFDNDEILGLVRRLGGQLLGRRRANGRQQNSAIIAEDPRMERVMELVARVAPSPVPVLVEGESGTGKELLARALHSSSDRASDRFVAENCAALPDSLLESELFGHERGAFTGAETASMGLFERADGGTLFLDEVGEIPIDLQGKLLRALQEGQFSRVGEDDEISVDVRVVAATNRDLRKEVDEGRFREDLYYRLTVFPIDVPPLRERLDDVPDLARHFLALSAQSILGEGHGLRLTSEHVAALKAYDWPGNVRELQNVIERGVITSRDGALQIEVPNVRHRPKDSVAAVEERRLYSDAELKELERSNLQAVLDHARWKISGAGGAAEFLGVRPATLSSRLKAMGIERPRSGSE